MDLESRVSTINQGLERGPGKLLFDPAPPGFVGGLGRIYKRSGSFLGHGVPMSEEMMAGM
jgi:hypothetical protein